MKNNEIEYAIVGSMIRDSACNSIGIERISDADMFRYPFIKDVFEALYRMSIENKPIDPITVKNFMKLSGKWVSAWDGEDGSWVQLLSYESDITTFEAHIGVFVEEHKQRVLQSICKQTLELVAFGGKSSDELILEAQKKLDNVIHQDKGMKITIAGSVLNKIKNDIEDSMKGIKPDIGIPNGFRNDSFDRQFSYGIGDLIIIAGRPGMGKSAFLIQLIKNLVIDRKVSVGLISLEMNQKENFYRLLACELNIDSYEVKIGGYNDNVRKVILGSIEKNADIPLYMNDSYDVDYNSLRAKIIYFVRVYGCKVIFIDHLGLINLSKLKKELKINTTEAVGEVTRMLKVIASELKISIVLLSQLSREVEKSGRNKPKMSDLRDSGRIEEDANKILMLFRPEYYDNSVVDSMGRSLKGITEVIYAKNRGGATGSWFFDSCMATHRYFMNDELTLNQAEERKSTFKRN